MWWDTARGVVDAIIIPESRWKRMLPPATGRSIIHLVIHWFYVILTFSLFVLSIAAFLQAITHPVLLTLGGSPLFVTFLMLVCGSHLSAGFGDAVRVG